MNSIPPFIQPIRIFHASDLHFGEEDRAALDWFAATVEREHPVAVVITGDITMRGAAREFRAAQHWLETLDAPLTLGIGNHDLPYYHHMLRRLTQPYARFEALSAAMKTDVYIPGVAVVPLCTVAPAQWRLNWSKGVVKAEILDKALAVIAARPAGSMTLVMAHHPLVETGTRGTALTRGGTAALDALAHAGVSAVLSGHVHDAFDMMHHGPSGSIRMIGAGTLSKRLRTTRPSFNELVIEGSALAVKVRDMA